MVEFRLYYNDNGEVICYTCENLQGNYILVDRQTFAEGNPHVKVIEGKVIKPSSLVSIIKYLQSNQGITCAKEDISIVVDSNYTEDIITWEEKLYESINC
jgi:hypothetical protein